MSSAQPPDEPSSGEPSSDEPVSGKFSFGKPDSGKTPSAKANPKKPPSVKPNSGKPPSGKAPDEPSSGEPSSDEPVSGKFSFGKPDSGKTPSAKADPKKPPSAKANSGKPPSGKAPNEPFSGEPSSDEPVSGKFSFGKPDSGKTPSAKANSGKPPSGKANSGKPSSGKANSRKTPSGKSHSTKPSSGKKGSRKKSSENKGSGRGRGIQQEVILENDGIVEAHWRMESSNRGSRGVPFSMRSVATRDQSLDPVFSIRGNFADDREDTPSRSFFKDDAEKGKDDDDAGKGFWKSAKSHKKCLIVGIVLLLIAGFAVLGVLLVPGLKNRAGSSDKDLVVGVTEESPNTAPSDNDSPVDVPEIAPIAAPSDDNSPVDVPDGGAIVTLPESPVDVPEIAPIAAPSDDNSPVDVPDGGAIVTWPPTDGIGGIDYEDTNAPTGGPTGQSGTLLPLSDDGPLIEDDGFTKIGQYQVMETVPHDANSFTQGLEILSRDKIDIMKDWRQQLQVRGRRLLRTGSDRSLADSTSYALESVGKYGRSKMRIVQLATGEAVEEMELDDEYFAEGCTFYSTPNTDVNGNDVVRIVQLTRKESKGFVYEISVPSTITTETQWSLSLVGEFEINKDDHTQNGQAWGIVYLPKRDQFLVSDGTKKLNVWELTETPTSSGTAFSFERVSTLKVRENRGTELEWSAIPQLLDLEWDPYSYNGNTVLANIFQSSEIVRIWVGDDRDGSDPDEGKITQVYDLSNLEALARASGILNGIAFVYDSVSGVGGPAYADQFWVTGKQWSTMYRIKLLDI